VSAAACAAFASGCGSDDPANDPRLRLRTPPAGIGALPLVEAQASRKMTQKALDEVRPTINGWVSAVRRNDLQTAARYFALPVVIQQSQGEVSVSDPADLDTFNATLPCGARLVKTQATGHYAVATFKLTSRPGHTCKDIGATVQVALAFKGRQIVEWRQLPENAQPAPTPTK
jgi:hypothetical protein